MLVSRGAIADGNGMAVPSPCTNVCVIDRASGYCMGCLRTIEEISAWGGADDRWKRSVIEALSRRAIRKD